MAWPLSSDFIRMLQNPQVGLKDAALKKVQIQCDANGQPLAWSGAFATVCKGVFPDTGRAVALRVFTSARAERVERYSHVGKFLAARPPLRSLVRFSYADQGVRSASDMKWYPLIEMDWVQGETLQKWAAGRCKAGDRNALSACAAHWVAVVGELAAAGVAHGDLQQDNVMVTPAGELKLVDYDCMFVPTPEMAERVNLEVGVDPYQHPSRNETTQLSSTLDRFSALFIWTALRALAADPSLWLRHVEAPGREPYDKLLIRRADIDAPDQSPLARELLASPDAQVRDLFRAMLDAAKKPIGAVPAMSDVLDPYRGLEALLRGRDWDAAARSMAALGAGRLAQAPAALRPLIDEARKRVDAREALEKAVASGNESTMVRAYDPKLLDDYPAARPAVTAAREAARAVPILQQLHQCFTANDFRKLTALWDANAALLENRRSATAYKAHVQVWKPRNAACDRLHAMFRNGTPPEDALAAAWAELQRVGGHPEAEKYRTVAEDIGRWDRMWSAFQRVPRTVSHDADRALVRAWDETLFAGRSECEPERPRVEEARQRLEVADDVIRLAKLPIDKVNETALWERGQALTAGYAPELDRRVALARERLRAFKALGDSLKTDDDRKIAQAWARLQSHQGTDLLPATSRSRARADVAVRRVSLLDAVAVLVARTDVADDEIDRDLVRLWDESLLTGCAAAEPWVARHRLAVRRLKLMDDLQRAFAARDTRTLAELGVSDMLDEYPMPEALADAIDLARKSAT
jgi:hypothetical protein